MLRYIVFVLLFSFSEWLWAGSSCASACCPVKPMKKNICPLQKKLYVDLGVSKTIRTHLSADEFVVTQNPRETRKFGVYPIHRRGGVFPDTLQIGMGYAWFHNAMNKELLPYVSAGVEYRKINPVNYPLTFTAKGFNILEGTLDRSTGYKAIPLQNSHLFATVKVNPLKIGCVFPYISAGFGVSWTQAYTQQYNIYISFIKQEKKYSFYAQLPAIKQSNLGFRLGSGFDLALTRNLLMSIGYSYNNLGKLIVHKPSVDGQDQREPLIPKGPYAYFKAFRALHLGNLTTHNVEFSLRYLFS